MKTFVCYIGLLITLALRLRATQFNSASHNPSSYIELGDRISNKVGATWKNQLDSFVDVVSTKIVDKLENEISNGNGLDNMMVLLENEAEIFDTDAYTGHNMALIQTEFIKKLKEKFNKSKFGNHLKKFGKHLKDKMKVLYLKHKDKLKKFLKVMIVGLVIPLAIKFIKKNLKIWEQRTLEATKKLDPDTRSVTTPIIQALYSKFEEKIDDYAAEHEISVDKELNVIQELEREKQDIENIENQEKMLKQN
ncbi:hypothetical protein MKS88_004593 [Plasmodium brasilianum]|uniref:Uncharacterized protein n=1 Tax=Plasmodium brasilianum TaxID=5824 RepID=A0ACB9Y7Y8_PLABR|nr:hypothetical protein MKS88_004593 [Plasmodium brasilianum]